MERRSSRCTSGGCSSGIIVISYPIRAAYILYSRAGVRARVFIVHIMYGNHVEFVCGSGARTGKRERRGICRGKKKKKIGEKRGYVEGEIRVRVDVEYSTNKKPKKKTARSALSNKKA